jgi:tetratricopeptide (TPR) repeat protein
LLHSHKGFSIIKGIASQSSQIVDLQLPIGIVEYYSGVSNVILRWTIALMGFEPSVESGLEKIMQAANEGKWSWIEAKAILCNLYLWVEDDPVLSLPHARELAYNFPENYWFNLLYLESLIRTNMFNDSYKVIEKMDDLLLDLTDRQKEWYKPYLSYEIALLHFHKKEYKESLKNVKKTIKNYAGELDVILGNAYLLEGMVYDKLSKRIKAKQSYRKCIELKNFSIAMKKAEKYLERSFSEI